jgi:pyrimidine-nucleoside phosphorylase
MNVYELIKKKRDGLELSTDEIRFLINGFVSGDIPDYQMSAFLMSVYFQGMSAGECVDLTMAMVDSGETIDLSEIAGFKVDKHSTGGVGDTTTLVLAPIVAACGGVVAKMSGRELGHTGGTIDKLESIPGMQVELPNEKFVETVNKIHVSLIAQTASLAPADKLIYALRNVTATVDSIPLIAASIMSKKLAAGSDGIVFDVKTGTGAFMQKYKDALELAKTMVNIGEGAGRRALGIITSMEQPLGNAVGNAIEVKEAIDTLQGEGPQDLHGLVMELGSHMLLISGIVSTLEEGQRRIAKCIETKEGLKKFGELIEAQGGNPEIIQNPHILPQPKSLVEIPSKSQGYVQRINAMDVGMASKILGAGRKTKDDSIDLSTGILLKKKIGDSVKAGESLAIFYSDGDNDKIQQAEDTFLNAYHIDDKPVQPPKFFYARVKKDGVEEI